MNALEVGCEQIIGAYGRGELSPPMALQRLLTIEEDLDRLRQRLAQGEEVRALAELAEGDPRDLARTAAALRTMARAELAGRDAAERVAACARMFDLALTWSPEAAVAGHSLGDPFRFAEATAEAAALLDRLGVLLPGRHLLDLGCGIGRLEEALARRVGAITGIDVSARMLAEARKRCTGLANVRLRPTSGLDLAPFVVATFDAVIAFDSLPYVFMAGGHELVDAMFAEIARVLRPGGDLVALNLTYRGGLARDRADAQALAAAHGLELLRSGTHDLELCDGATFHFRRR
ncbi:MAG: class I SAM-dependent methyltransferase [Geminicoccaceae bacterium]